LACSAGKQNWVANSSFASTISAATAPACLAFAFSFSWSFDSPTSAWQAITS